MSNRYREGFESPAIKRQDVEDVLDRLTILLKRDPGSVLNIHLNLNRERGIELLSDIFATDEDPKNPTYS